MKLFLNGGGSGPSAAGAYIRLGETADISRPVLCIPFAMEEEDREAGCERVGRDLARLKAKIETVSSGDQLRSKYMGSYGCVYILDGNTFRLMDELRRSGGYEMLLGYARSGGVIYGEGAGAVILGADIGGALCLEPNDAGLPDTVGLDLLGGASVFPHYRAVNKQQQRFLEYYSTDRIVYAVPNEATICLDGINYELMGTKNAYQFVNGKRTLL